MNKTIPTFNADIGEEFDAKSVPIKICKLKTH